MIARVAIERTMPPSLADPAVGDLAGAHRLDDRTIAVLERWSQLGAPRGPDVLRPQRSLAGAEHDLGPPDLVVTMEEAWTIPAAGPDLFRAFSLDAVGGEHVHLVAAELRPSAPRAIRFAQLMTDPKGQALTLDSQSAEPGYDCADGLGISAYSAIATWPIGRALDRLPKHAVRVIRGNDRLVLWLHAHPQGKSVEERTSIALWLDDSPRHSVAFMEPIDLDRAGRTVEHGMERLRMERVLDQDVSLISMMPRLTRFGILCG